MFSMTHGNPPNDSSLQVARRWGPGQERQAQWCCDRNATRPESCREASPRFHFTTFEFDYLYDFVFDPEKVKVSIWPAPSPKGDAKRRRAPRPLVTASADSGSLLR